MKDSISEKLDALLSRTNEAVRHIQYGHSTHSTNSGNEIIDLSGFTNVNKMMVILTPAADYWTKGGSNSSGWQTSSYVSSLSTSSLVVAGTRRAEFNYTVVEFY